MFISESIQICLKSCVYLYYLSCFKKHDFMTYEPCFRMWFMKIAKFERVWCSAISEQKVKIYIIQHTNMHINCRCRISSSLQNVVTEDRPSSQHVSPRGWCAGAGEYNSVGPWLSPSCWCWWVQITECLLSPPPRGSWIMPGDWWSRYQPG